MNNSLKTIMLLGVLSVGVITLGGFLAGQSGLYTAFFFAVIMNGVSYFYSDKIALMVSGAKPLDRSKHRDLYKTVEELAKKMSLPMPKLFISPATQANAFATGRDPNHASVAVTKGLMDTLSPQEVRAVLAHELSHVKNRDILIASIAAVLASVIGYIANMALWGGFRSNDDEGGNSAGPGLGLLLAFLTPVGAALIQMAVSREREFGADATGAKTIGTGEPLATALLAIHDSTKRAPLHTNPAFSSLYIGNPLGAVGGMMQLFSTHPPVKERVKRLRSTS